MRYISSCQEEILKLHDCKMTIDENENVRDVIGMMKKYFGKRGCPRKREDVYRQNSDL